MRVTQVMLSKGFGGAERYFVDLSAALADAGHAVQAVCHKRFSGLPSLREHAGLRIDTVNVRGPWDPLAVRRIAAQVQSFAPDIVHGQLSRGTRAAGMVCRRLGLPLVANMHNYPDFKYYRDVGGFIAPTEDLRRYVLGQGVSRDRVCVVPNFSSLPPAGGARVAAAGPVRFLAFGRFVHKKGFDLLLRALRQCLDDGLDARLVLGGDGVERVRLERLSAELGLHERVRFAGWLGDVAGALDEADVFVLPSRDEPFGIVLLEAMARGLPVVATRTRGPVEVLDEDVAWLVSVDDAPSLAAGMLATARDPDGRTRRARLLLERYRARYHRDAVVPRVVSFYETVLARGRRR